MCLTESTGSLLRGLFSTKGFEWFTTALHVCTFNVKVTASLSKISILINYLFTYLLAIVQNINLD